MELFILSAPAAYLFFIVFSMSTKNIRSALVFKFAPFIMGLGLFFLVLTKLGFVLQTGG